MRVPPISAGTGANYLHRDPALGEMRNGEKHLPSGAFCGPRVCGKCGARGRHIDVRPELDGAAAARKPDREAMAVR